MRARSVLLSVLLLTYALLGMAGEGLRLCFGADGHIGMKTLTGEDGSSSCRVACPDGGEPGEGQGTEITLGDGDICVDVPLVNVEAVLRLDWQPGGRSLEPLAAEAGVSCPPVGAAKLAAVRAVGPLEIPARPAPDPLRTIVLLI